MIAPGRRAAMSTPRPVVLTSVPCPLPQHPPRVRLPPPCRGRARFRAGAGTTPEPSRVATPIRRPVREELPRRTGAGEGPSREVVAAVAAATGTGLARQVTGLGRFHDSCLRISQNGAIQPRNTLFVNSMFLKTSSVPGVRHPDGGRPPPRHHSRTMNLTWKNGLPPSGESIRLPRAGDPASTWRVTPSGRTDDDHVVRCHVVPLDVPLLRFQGNSCVEHQDKLGKRTDRGRVSP